MVADEVKLGAAKVLSQLKDIGISHIVWLPDSEVGSMYRAMVDQKDISIISVCREGEAVAIATGLTLGGRKPVILCQNTGFFESGNSLRGSLEFRIPLLFLISYRGWKKDTPMTDSAGVFTEPILKAWGIKYYLMESDKDINKISLAYTEACETNSVVAVLVGREHG